MINFIQEYYTWVTGKVTDTKKAQIIYKNNKQDLTSDT